MKPTAIASPPMQPTRRAGLLSRLRYRIRHRNTRAGLMELDDHLLRDIGLSREVLLYSRFMGTLPQTSPVRTTWLSVCGQLPWR